MTTDQNEFLKWLAQNGAGIFVVCVVIAVFVVTVFVLVKLWTPLLRTVLTMNAILTLPETLARHETSLAEMRDNMAALAGSLGEARADISTVKHEVLPNSGGSLADEVNRQGERLMMIDKTQKSTQGAVRSQGRRLRAIETSLEMTQQPEAVKHARQRAKMA